VAVEDDLTMRAAEIARSGDCPDLDAIKTRMRREGHQGVDALFARPEVLVELGRLCRQARMKVRHRPFPISEDDGDAL
jgi:hypothetical protein